MLVSELSAVSSLEKHEDSKFVKIYIFFFFFAVRFYGVAVL